MIDRPATAAAPLLMINGNSRHAITERLHAHARRRLGGDIIAVTAHDSVPYVETPRDCVLSAAAIVRCLEQDQLLMSSRPDVILLACFGEPGIDAVRAMSGLPVLGMLEASVVAALQLGGSCSIITPGRHWPAMLAARLRQIGLDHICRAIHSLDMDDLDPVVDRNQLVARVDALLERHHEGAEHAWIIGGAALSGLCPALTQRPGQRLIDSFDAALGQVAAFRLTHVGYGCDA